MKTTGPANEARSLENRSSPLTVGNRFAASQAALSWRGLGRWFALALLLRLLAIFWFDASRHCLESAHEHAAIARNLYEGKGFCFNFLGYVDRPLPTSQQAPLVPYLLAGCYWLTGCETPASLWLMLGVQGIISAVTVVGLVLLAGTLGANRWAQTGVAVVACFYPPLLVSPLHLQALPWVLAWLTALLLSCQYARLRKPRAWVGVGLSAAGGILTEPILAAVLAGLTLLLLAEAFLSRRTKLLANSLYRHLTTTPAANAELNDLLLAHLKTVQTDSKSLVRSVVLGWALLVVLLLPWTMRNYMVHGRLLLVKDSLAYVFWQGNNPQSQGSDKLLVAPAAAEELARVHDPRTAFGAGFSARHESVSVNTALPHEAVWHLMELPTETARMDFFARANWQMLGADPWLYPRQCGQRLRYWLFFDATNPRSYLWHYRVGYLLLVALALPALWQGRHYGYAASPLLVAALMLSTVHVLIITSARFRVPLELLLVLPAGFTLAAMAATLSRVLRMFANVVLSTPALGRLSALTKKEHSCL